MSENITLKSIDLYTKDDYNIIESIYNVLAESIKGRGITSVDVILMTTKAMQLVEKYNTLSGIQKKNLVLNSLKKIIQTKVKKDDDRDIILDFITIFLPPIIDTIISVDKKEIKIATKKCLSFLSCK